MTDKPSSSRREFLTGKAVHKELRGVGDRLADEIKELSTAPVAGETVRLETRAMGCPWCVILNPGPTRQVMCASDAFEQVHRIEDLLTIYRPDSETSLLNQTAFAEAPQLVSPELFEFLQVCRSLWESTHGAFDPAAGHLVQLWKETRNAGRIPEQGEIDAALQRSGMRHVELTSISSMDAAQLDEPRVRFLADVKLDFAAIGKGYGIDAASQHLIREGVIDHLVHGGQSSLSAHGQHGQLAGWPIGLKNPLLPDRHYATILLQDEALSTSGSNIQYFRFRGQRYGHILDPRTGWPADSLLSVTVIAKSATLADALSTAFYVIGLDNALQYCDDHPEIGALFLKAPTHGKTLKPVIRNISEDRLFFESPPDSDESV